MKTKQRIFQTIFALCLSVALLVGMTGGEVYAMETNEENVTSVKVNQVGYYPDASKIAVISGSGTKMDFYVIDADTGEAVFGAQAQRVGRSFCANFSEVSEEGSYYILTSEGKRSPTFRIAENVYQELTDALVKFFYYQRCGCALTDAGLLSHKACHDWDANVYDVNEKKTGTMDAVGGWHDAGDYGRYILPQAAAVYQLMAAWSKNPRLFGDATGIPESGNGVPDILDECRWELNWMLKMQEPDGGVHPQVHSKNFIPTMMPDKDPYELAVTPVTTESTAKFAAVMAYASGIFRGIDEAFAERCLRAAVLSWRFLEAHPEGLLDLVSFTQYSHTGTRESVDLDDIYWAAAELFRVTGEKVYLDKFISLQGEIGTQHDFGWGSAGGFGTIAFPETDSELIGADFRKQILADYVAATVSDPYRLSTSVSNVYFNADTNWWWGSNMCIGNDAYQLYSAGELGNRSDFWIAGYRQIDYLLGENVHSTCFVTDFGSIFPKTPLHGPSKAGGGRIPGALVGGAYEREDFYEDSPENYYCNEVSCYYNSALVVTLAYASVCRNTAEEVIPGNLKKTDVSGLTAAKILERIRNGTSEEETTGGKTDSATEPTTTGAGQASGGCQSAMREMAPMAALLATGALIRKRNRNRKKQQGGCVQ